MAQKLTAILTFLGICFRSYSFNIEEKSPKVFSGTQGEYFGYTVALHKADSGYWALVGAPLSDKTGVLTQEKNGAVFRCPISGSGSCINMAIDDEPSSFRENKTRQWMGATLHSIGENQGIVACAPRFKDAPPGNIWLHGRCGYVDGKSFTPGTSFWNPCKNGRQGNSNFGYCQAGFSATVGSGFLFGGLPGTQQALGRLGIQSIRRIIDGDTNYAISSGDRLSIGNMMGYSIAWGRFSRTSYGDVVGGAPDGSNKRGKVIIYKVEGVLPIQAVIENTDTTMATGSYFGSVLCAVDLTNDGISDLVVGAPFYSKNRDEGKAYVYVTDSKGAINLKGSVTGEDVIGARFASSIASAGDLNNDKYNDIIIGAPYGGPDGKGAVYVYHGSKDGLGNSYEPVQKIYASTLGGVQATFGHALSGGLDFDGNGFPDILVGSYEADKVHIFKSKPVLKMTATLKTNNSKIPLSKNNGTNVCKTEGANIYQCLTMEFCMTVSGKGIPNNIDLAVKFEFDKDQLASKRAFIFDGASKLSAKQVTLSYTANNNSCYQQVVYVQENVKNVLRPIVIAASYKYKEPTGGCGSTPCAVSDMYQSKSLTTQATYVRDCGSDDICNANLVVAAKPIFSGGQAELVFGLVNTFSLEVNVTNKGENAFLAEMDVLFPDDLSAVGVDFVGEQSPLWERQASKDGKSSIYFNLDSPFLNDQKLKILVKFTIVKERPSAKTLSFKIVAKSVSAEISPDDNTATVSVTTGLFADLTVSGSASPDKFFYDSKPLAQTKDLKNETEVGPVVEYSFLIQNRGPSPVQGLQAHVSLVTKHNDKWLLMLFSATVDGSFSCNLNNTINPMNLTTQDSNVDLGKSRQRREAKVEEKGVTTLNCRTGTCAGFNCYIGLLKKSEAKTIKLRTRLFQNTFIEENRGPTRLVSKVSVVIPSEERAFLRQPTQQQPDLAEVTVHISPPVSTKESKGKPIAWWIILLSVLGALLLIIAFVIILWKVGFFKRKLKAERISNPTGQDDDGYMEM